MSSTNAMSKHFITVCFLLFSASSLAEPITVYFTQDFGENGFVSGSFTGEDVDSDDKIVFSDMVAGPDTVTAYSVKFTPGPANSGDITSFTLGLALLDRLEYSIDGTVVVVAGGEGPPLEHFYNCDDQFSCVVGDVDNAYSSGGANTVTSLTFNDVPPDFWASSFIDILAANGVSAGCGGGNYCPDDTVTRAQMAVFLERGMKGSGFSPPAATGAVFLDVGAGDFAASFIEQLSRDGITAGCGNNNYCPNGTVTRDQMAVFLLKAKYGANYSPPAATGIFEDVPLSYWAVHWIEQLAAEGITAGCGGGNYCPEAPVDRDQMAVFLVRTFDLGIVLTKQEAYDDLRVKHFNFLQDVVHAQAIPGSWSNDIFANIDLDADGDLDIVAGVMLGEDHQAQERQVGEVYLFRNNLAEGFTVEPSGVFGLPRSIIIGDFNNDGLDDVYFAQEGYDFEPFPGHTDYLFLQTIGGGLIDATYTNLPPIMDFAHGSCAGDIDSNGTLDVMTVGDGHKLLINDGTANFTDEKNSRLPLVDISSDYIFDNNLQNSIPIEEHPNLRFSFVWCAMADVDIDSDIDIILGGSNSDGMRTLAGDDLAHKHVIIFNDGQGNFSYDSATSRVNSTEVQNGDVVGMLVDDFNMDGCPDFVTTAHNDVTNQDTNFFLNNCSGAFTIIYSTSDPLDEDSDQEWFWDLSKEDLDDDGVSEYVLTGSSPNRNHIFENTAGVISTRVATSDDLYRFSPATFLKIEPTVPE